MSVCYLTVMKPQTVWQSATCQLSILILLGNRTLSKIHSRGSWTDDMWHGCWGSATAVVAFLLGFPLMRTKESTQDLCPLESPFGSGGPLFPSGTSISWWPPLLHCLLAVTFPRPGWISSSHNWVLGSWAMGQKGPELLVSPRSWHKFVSLYFMQRMNH